MNNCCYLSSIPLLYTIIRHRLLFKSSQRCFNEEFDFSIKPKAKPKPEESKDKKDKDKKDKKEKEDKKEKDKKEEEKDEDKKGKDEKEKSEKEKDEKEEKDEDKEKDKKEDEKEKDEQPPLVQPVVEPVEYISKYKYPEIPPLVHDDKKIDFIDFVLIFAAFSPTVEFEHKVECIFIFIFIIII